MKRYSRWCLALLLLPGYGRAAEPHGKVVHETWEAAYLEGGRAGHVHTTVREVNRDGEKILRTTVALDLTVKRFKELVRLRMEAGTDETPEGKVTGVFMRQYLGKSQMLELTGIAEGDQLHVKIAGDRPIDKRIPWNDKVIGLYRQERLFKERKVKPGDKFAYLSYQPEINAVVNTRVTVKDYEEVDIPTSPPPSPNSGQGEGGGGTAPDRPLPAGRGSGLGSTKKARLLRVEARADKIANYQPPALTLWLGPDLLPVRSRVDMDGLGELLLYRTTRALALQNQGTSPPIDIGRRQLVRLNRRIREPYSTTAAVYRITIKGDDDPATTFAHDGRQQIKNIKGSSFQLEVRALREPKTIDHAEKISEEFLKSCYFINSDDARVKRLAREAVGDETDPWAKAKSIEKWVRDNMKNKNFTEALATADHVARTLEGDCTEHAMLAAAMCRAADVPSRTAIGLVYVDSTGEPAMGFHMWTEVWVRGQWMPIDATLGRRYVGATHLKITDQSWHDVHDLQPLLPVLRVLGKVKIEVISATTGD